MRWDRRKYCNKLSMSGDISKVSNLLEGCLSSERMRERCLSQRDERGGKRRDPAIIREKSWISESLFERADREKECPMISHPIRVDRAINFSADKIGPLVSVFPSEAWEGIVMSSFSPEAFEIAYRHGNLVEEEKRREISDIRDLNQKTDKEKSVREWHSKKD